MSFVPVTAPQRGPADPAEWGGLRDYIETRTGVLYSDARLPLLVARLEPLLRFQGRRAAEDLLTRLQFDGSGGELQALYDLATPHESGFFREPGPLFATARELLPALSPARPAKVWSAGCAAGQEAYTLRYILGRAGLPAPSILGTDLSARCVTDAQRGEYRESAVRAVEAADRKLLFEERGAAFKVRPEWRTGVKFVARNLMDEGAASDEPVDLIVCRNVLIYFSEAARKAVVERFYESLRDGGFLLLGHAESLHGVSRSFKPVPLHSGLAYQKD